MANNGYLLIADISGYTRFLSTGEPDHAQEILQSLFETLLESIRPPFKVSKLEGDAIFAYTDEHAFLESSTLIDAIEDIYASFKQAQEQMHFNTTCTCNACHNIRALDLKIVTHYGNFLISDIRDSEELTGLDVILIHRLLKNEVYEKTGVFAYSLFTDTVINRLDLPDFFADLPSHTESYEHIGDVTSKVYDLKKFWDVERDRRRIIVDKDSADFVLEFEVPIPPSQAWDYVNSPQAKMVYRKADSVYATQLQHGRMGVGTVHHCAHGKQTNDEMILDWRPFESVTSLYQVKLPYGINFNQMTTTQVKAIPTGTLISMRWSQTHNQNVILRFISRFLWKRYGRPYLETEIPERLKNLIQRDLKSGKVVTDLSVGQTVKIEDQSTPKLQMNQA